MQVVNKIPKYHAQTDIYVVISVVYVKSNDSVSFGLLICHLWSGINVPSATYRRSLFI